jgi:hypothetical protein
MGRKYCLQSVQICPGFHLPSYLGGIGERLTKPPPRWMGCNGRLMKLNIHVHLLPSLRMHGAILPVLRMSSCSAGWLNIGRPLTLVLWEQLHVDKEGICLTLAWSGAERRVSRPGRIIPEKKSLHISMNKRLFGATQLVWNLWRRDESLVPEGKRNRFLVKPLG